MWTKENSIAQLIEGVYNNGPEILMCCETSDDISEYVDRVMNEHLNYPVPSANDLGTNWFIPYEYKQFDIETFCIEQCQSDVELERVKQELVLYNQYNMIPVLRCMKYIVDTLRQHEVIWGIGRGSSVASYCLFLLGVHKINSLQYDIPLNEFFK